LIEASESLLEFSGDDDNPLGISVGVAIFDPDDNEPLDDLVARADEAMYAIKNAGKGGFHMAAEPKKQTDPAKGVRTIEKPSP
jgi:GGDEF domain-containing protein